MSKTKLITIVIVIILLIIDIIFIYNLKFLESIITLFITIIFFKIMNFFLDLQRYKRKIKIEQENHDNLEKIAKNSDK